jgi:ribosomal RNA-processing protein 9
MFTSGKEGSIMKWDLSTGKKVATFYKQRPSSSDSKGKKKATSNDLQGHLDEVWALALSSDGKYLVSAGKDKRIVVWDAEKGEWVKTFYGTFGHRDHVSVSIFFYKVSLPPC